METKFFSGNYTLGIGQPYVILSTYQDSENYRSEKIIIFHGYNGVNSFVAYRTKYPIISGKTIEEFISTEIQVCKDDILSKILFPKYYQQLEAANYNVKIELKETNSGVIGLLRDKFPTEIENIKTRTINKILKAQIAIYQSVIVERNDFDID